MIESAGQAPGAAFYFLDPPEWSHFPLGEGHQVPKPHYGSAVTVLAFQVLFVHMLVATRPCSGERHLDGAPAMAADQRKNKRLLLHCIGLWRRRQKVEAPKRFCPQPLCAPHVHSVTYAEVAMGNPRGRSSRPLRHFRLHPCRLTCSPSGDQSRASRGEIGKIISRHREREVMDCQSFFRRAPGRGQDSLGDRATQVRKTILRITCHFAHVLFVFLLFYVYTWAVFGHP